MEPPSASFVGHVKVHCEATQWGVPGTLPPDGGKHWLPHMPQLSRSLVMSTHCPQHSVRPFVQKSMHVPQLQVWPEPHLWPHMPQLKRSFIVSASQPVAVSGIAESPPLLLPLPVSVVPSVPEPESVKDSFCPAPPWAQLAAPVASASPPVQARSENAAMNLDRCACISPPEVSHGRPPRPKAPRARATGALE